MSVVRYEELDQIAGELLPERTLLGVLSLPFGGGYGDGGDGGGGYPGMYHPEPHVQCYNTVSGSTGDGSILPILSGNGINILSPQNMRCEAMVYPAG